jgi:glutamyl-tRNA reductase
MKNIFAIGINHKTAPISVREQFYLTPTQQELFLSELKNNPAVIEGFVLSTCNRTEVYLNTLDGFEPFAFIFKLFTAIKKVQTPAQYEKHFYIYREEVAAKHLFQVVTSLDSLVIGEKQILGQVKDAIKLAQDKGMFDKKFNILTNLAIRTAKKAQTETQISFGGSSVSWAAMAKAEEIFGSLEGKSVLLIGAGEMGKLTASQVQNKQFRKIYVMNRTEENAKELAEQYGGEAVGFVEIKDVLTEVDLCICSSGAPHYILEKRTVEKIMPIRENRKMVFVDISMPRNIDPAVSEVDNVLLYAIDNLNEVVEKNMKTRGTAIREVEAIIEQKISEFHKKISSDSQSEAIA